MERPKLKPCPLCTSPLEYWDNSFVACTGSECGFTFEISLGVAERKAMIKERLKELKAEFKSDCGDDCECD